MIVGNVTELEIVGVFDRGLPNKERIIIYVNDSTNMGQYGIMLGIRTQNAMATPIADQLFWFGDGIVAKDDVLFIYTGPGVFQHSPFPNSTSTGYSLHWGKASTVLANSTIVPILCRIDAVHIQPDKVDRPQLPLQQ